MNNEYLTISDVNKIVKNTIDNNSILSNIYIKGEISNFKYHTRGHLYFSLKDESSRINAVMFSYNASNLNFMPKDGDSVLIKGRVSVYEATGSYQIYVEQMSLDGIGNLYILFEELKRKLDKEGLFNQEHKKHVKKIPQKIGVITASTGAAIRDIISTINKRFPLVEIYLFPSLVQGTGAKDNIVKMINLAQNYDIDTLIIGRGGGSIEDLWAFNEEIVARAIFNCKIPTISGVGHEIDFTISDFVSDLRAPTPTGAAILSVPDKNEILRYLITCKERLNTALDNKLYSYSELLNKYKSNYLLNNPKRMYEVKEQKLDILCDKLNSNMKNILEKNNTKMNNLIEKFKINIKNNYDKDIHKLETLKIKINLLNPENILNKGYSIIYKNGQIVKDINNITKNDNLNIMLKNGNIDTIVKGVNKK